IQLLLNIFPTYLNQDFNFFGNKVDSSQLNDLAASELENIGRNAFAVTIVVFGGVISAISVFDISFYLLLYRDSVFKCFVSPFPSTQQEKVCSNTSRLREAIGSWQKGQIIL